MKAGGVKFAETPEEAEAHAEAILALEIDGHVPRGVLVDSRVAVKQEYYAGVTWDGTRKRPVLIFSDMGGIDIEEVAETHPDRVGRAPLLDAAAVLRLRGQAGDRLRRRDRQGAQPPDPDPRAARAAVPRARHGAGRDQPAGGARGRHVHGRRRPHGHGERGAPAPAGAAARARRRRRGDAPGARGDARSSWPARRSTRRTTAASPAT